MGDEVYIWRVLYCKRMFYSKVLNLFDSDLKNIWDIPATSYSYFVGRVWQERTQNCTCQFGRVMAVCVGAMMVGSIKATVEEGESVGFNVVKSLGILRSVRFFSSSFSVDIFIAPCDP
jgi:hypothetical protein